jgi:chromosomal replication initiation ATPase DnaA
MEKKEENIAVAVRIRPVQERELTQGNNLAWECNGNFLIKEIGGAREFFFDKVYDQNTQTSEIFNELANLVIEKCMLGYNGCIFCYGQTGSGKTFTMHGAKKSQGIVPLTVEAIFTYIKNSFKKDFLIRCSYIEIYNESVNDLLNPNLLNLQLAEDKKVIMR